MTKQFLILGNARTGTTFLQTLLDSHSEIKSYGEILHLLAKPKRQLHQFLEDPINFLENQVYVNHPRPIKAVGFKTLYTQMGEDSIFLSNMDTRNVCLEIKTKREIFSEYMRRNFDLVEIRQRFADLSDYLQAQEDIRIIHIKRKNKLDSYLSRRLAEQSGVWNSTTGSYNVDKIHLDFEDCLKYFQNTEAFENKFDQMFKKHPVITIYYEDMVRDTSQTVSSILTFLGLNMERLSSPLTKQNRREAASLISNYQQLREQFKDHKWKELFN
jgi:LPS sulfotransferase NodH